MGNKTLDKSDVVDILFRIAEQENDNCFNFCNLNRHSRKAIDERKAQSRLVQATITLVMNEICKL